MRRDLAFNKNSLENIFPLQLYKTNEGTRLHGSGLSLTAFCIKMLSFMRRGPLLIRNTAECLPSLFLAKPTAGWLWICYFFRHDLPNLFSLLFRLLGQRYVVKESYGGSELGFSYCTWSSRIEKKLKESHKNHMTKQLKINKRNEAVSRPFVSTHRYEVNQSTQPTEMGALGREEPHCETMYLSWLFSESPRLRSSGNPQAIHQQLEDFIRRAQLPLFLNRDWKHRLLCKRILSLLFPS